MPNEKRVIRLERDGPAGIGMPEMTCSPEDFQSPLPTQHVHVYFEDPEIGMSVGVWDTTTMQEAFGPYPGDEFIVVLEGGFQMLDGDGNGVPATTGQSVCFRNAVPVSWKQDGYLKKFYITYLDPRVTSPVIESAKGGVFALDSDLKPSEADRVEHAPDAKITPRQHDRILFTNDTGNMTVGLWDCEAMETEFAPFPTHEFVHLLEGDVTIVEEDGTSNAFTAGDVFFVPHGTVCSWRVPHYIRKYYAALDPTFNVRSP